VNFKLNLRDNASASLTAQSRSAGKSTKLKL